MRLAVVSPFVDRRHGTERALAEVLIRLARDHAVEIHLYSQRVEDLPVTSPGFPAPIVWHRVPAIPGPHLLQFVFWFFACAFCRWRDARFRGLRCDLLYSPGINSLSAGAITVHIVFQAFYLRVRSALRLRRSPISSWPLLIHRRLYYRLIVFLENRVYTRSSIALSAVSGLVAAQLSDLYGRPDVRVIPNGVDVETFNPAARASRRAGARSSLALAPGDFVLLLIGNDWKKKGLDSLLEALQLCEDLPLKLLVAGSDDRSAYTRPISAFGLLEKVRFCPPSDDVMRYYAAADLYAGPSLEDAYGLPVLEAMACGMPVIASRFAGVSQIIHEAEDGFVLPDPQDARALAGLIRRVCGDSALCARVGQKAALTAREWTWDAIARQMDQFLREALQVKQPHPPVPSPERESS